MEKLKSKGIHHISSIVGNPQENVDFYGGVLGLRMTKKTVNHDDPNTYHLYFSNGDADPGTHITFFPWENAMAGRIGDGQVGRVSFVIPPNSMTFWETRLAHFAIPYKKITRFGETYLQFKDYHGLNNELVERAQGKLSAYSTSSIAESNAIKGFAGAVLFTKNPESTLDLLENIFDLVRSSEDEDYVRLQGEGEFGNVIDVKKSTSQAGYQGVGTVHHIAMRSSDSEHKQWRRLIDNEGYQVTPFIDRKYFKSIYFREFGNILFEVATDGPGFDVDEPFDQLGETLVLPEKYEPYRARIEHRLKTIELRNVDE